MFARTVHAAVWLLVQQYGKVVFAGDTFHQVHYQLVVVVGKVGVFKYGGQLKLVGSHFVMTCLDGNTQLVTFYFQFFHKSRNAGRNRAEIVVLQLLVFGGGVSH